MLPAVVIVLQWVYAIRFAWPVWVAIGLAAAISPLPLIPWRAGRRQASLAAAVLSLAVQFVMVMAFVIPPTANAFSARDLAEHFNRLGRLPTRLFVVEERPGSFAFYLNPQLRSELKDGQLISLFADSAIQLQPGDIVALSDRKLVKAAEYPDLDNAPYESVGRYRLYCIANQR